MINICKCGCGKKTTNNLQTGKINDYIHGHNQKKLSKVEMVIRKSVNCICKCGCGKKTKWSKINQKYNKYIHGHGRKKKIEKQKLEFEYLKDNKEVYAQTIANWWYGVYVKEQRKTDDDYYSGVPDLSKQRNKRTRTIFLKVVDKLIALKLNPSSKHDVKQYLYAINEYTTFKKRISYPTILYDKNSDAKWESFLKDYNAVHSIGSKNENAPAWFCDDTEIRDRVFLSMGVIAKIIRYIQLTKNMNGGNGVNAKLFLKSKQANRIFNPGMEYGYLLINPIIKLILKEDKYKKYFDGFMINNLKTLRSVYRHATKEDDRYFEKIKLFRKEIKSGLKSKDVSMKLEYRKKGIGGELLKYL